MDRTEIDFDSDSVVKDFGLEPVVWTVFEESDGLRRVQEENARDATQQELLLRQFNDTLRLMAPGPVRAHLEKLQREIVQPLRSGSSYSTAVTSIASLMSNRTAGALGTHEGMRLMEEQIVPSLNRSVAAVASGSGISFAYRIEHSPEIKVDGLILSPASQIGHFIILRKDGDKTTALCFNTRGDAQVFPRESRERSFSQAAELRLANSRLRLTTAPR